MHRVQLPQFRTVTFFVQAWRTAACVLYSTFLAVSSCMAVETTRTLAPDPETPTTVPAAPSTCEELPSGNLTEEDLRKLVPDESSGTVYIRWRTEAEYNLAGYNVLRREHPSEPYMTVNRELIPGNAPNEEPQEYCFADRPLPRGKVYYYSVQTVNDKGKTYIVKGTEDTQVRVKTLDEERDWLRKRAEGTAGNLRTLPQTERFLHLPLKGPHRRVPPVDDRHSTALY